MDPDELHTKYFEHNAPSAETLRFMEKQAEINDSIQQSLTSLKEIVSRIDARSLAIHEQTTKTNGRVTKLERWQNRIIGAGFAVAGVWSVFQFLLPYVKAQTVTDEQFKNLTSLLDIYAQDQKQEDRQNQDYSPKKFTP